MDWLAENCPRLAKARDDFRAARRAESRERRLQAAALLEAEKLVAHRELQLVRACQRPNGGYLEARTRKLNEARALLERRRRRASA